ncbi:hypothetical protein PORCAN_2125 [Porphyromonas crevioricanis JCM 13913]|nr:hypothetical protein PORCAN_2125 [Porphyromonas crevioricanis JCM 13913]
MVAPSLFSHPLSEKRCVARLFEQTFCRTLRYAVIMIVLRLTKEVNNRHSKRKEDCTFELSIAERLTIHA